MVFGNNVISLKNQKIIPPQSFIYNPCPPFTELYLTHAPHRALSNPCHTELYLTHAPHRALSNPCHTELYLTHAPHAQSNRLRLQEKVKQGVRALEWNGDELFCGFELGRVIRMKINIYDWTMSPLTFPDSYGSGVTQLSCKGNSLLVSTVERTWMVDTDTHKLEQVRMCST